MLSKPEAGWTEVKIGSFTDRASYLTDVPFQCLKAFIHSYETNLPATITDSPLLLSAFYNSSELLGEDFNCLVLKVAESYKTLNVLLLRDKPYNPKGRLQTEAESDAMAEPMKQMLSKYNVPHMIGHGIQDDYDKIVEAVLAKLFKSKNKKLGCVIN